ncbi:unnamed protein product [Polarella glacialis]|uniref:BTB domain-containing protein n=1 Tax=Polarella glacialis TaxID=89957 RepID=A0A813FXN7_POLGL|nr:unnamed protein product [Polarella glacialis]
MTGLTEYLGELLKSGTDADVVLVMGADDGGGEQHSAHSLILGRVIYFQKALSSAFKEGATKRVVIEDVAAKHLMPLIEVLYTDKLTPPADPHDLLHLLSLCRRFAFPGSVSECVMTALQASVVWGKNTKSLLVSAYSLQLPLAIEACLRKVSLDVLKLRSELHMDCGGEVTALNLAKGHIAIAETAARVMEQMALPPTPFQTQDYVVMEQPSVFHQMEVRVSKKLLSVTSAEASLGNLTKCVQDQKEVWSLLFEAMSVSVRGTVFDEDGDVS